METLLTVCTGMYSAVWHNRQTAVLLEKFGVGHVCRYALSSLILGVLHFTHSEQAYARNMFFNPKKWVETNLPRR